MTAHRFIRHVAHTAVAVSLLVGASIFALGGALPAAADTSITFYGAGWGHGVGMSQYGAYGMASADSASASTILTHYYTSTAVQTLTQPSALRIRIASGLGSSTFTGSSAINFYIDNGDTAIASAAANQPLTITAENGGFRLSDPSATYVSQGHTVQVRYAPSPVRVSGTQCGNGGCRYSHGLIVVHNPGTSLMLTVETLSMDEYLYGLGEVPSSWPAAALQAQAIAGRTYANYFTTARRANGTADQRGYDLDASTADQYYIGYEKEGEPTWGQYWVAAVNATSGQTVTYNGSPIQTFYFSSSGGYTENSENVFSAALPYLRGVPDPRDANSANPNFRWSRSYTTTQLSTWLGSQSDTNVGTVSGIALDSGGSVSGRIDKGTVTISGSGGTKQVSGVRFRNVVNSGAAGSGGGLSTQLLSTLVWEDPTHDLHGSLDWVHRAPGGVQVAGWAIDDDTSDPIDVQVYVDSTGYDIGLANLYRPDVGAVYPAAGPNHGFIASVPVPVGTHQICAWAINTGLGAGFNKSVGCQTVTISGDPYGSVDLATRPDTGVRVAGWTIDPDTASPIAVHVYVDGAFAGATGASNTRTDVANAYYPYGASHGYDTDVGNFGPGPHSVCVYAINDTQPGTNPSLGCRTPEGTPFGFLDLAQRAGAGVRVAGWTIDPDIASPIAVHVYVDGAFVGAIGANMTRTDVGDAFPPYGANHGYDATVGNIGSGTHTACVYGINNNPSAPNIRLGCASFS